MAIFSHTLALSLTKLRQAAPFVGCATSPVGLDFLFNALVALGVKPVLVQAREDAESLLQLAQGLVIETRSPTAENAEAMRQAAGLAGAKSMRWVLDVRGLGQSAYRDKLIYDLLNLKPAILRAKSPEVMQITRHLGYASRGLEQGRTSEEMVEAARWLAQHTGGAVVMTGPTNVIADASRVVRITNGHKLMTRVAGMGGGLSATLASFAVVEEDCYLAAAIGLGIYNIVAEIAAEGQEGPMAFRNAFIDKMTVVDANHSMRRLKIL